MGTDTRLAQQRRAFVGADLLVQQANPLSEASQRLPQYPFRRAVAGLCSEHGAGGGLPWSRRMPQRFPQLCCIEPSSRSLTARLAVEVKNGRVGRPSS
jgi:hypothetical protein